jgi:hypothetical protein
VAAYLDDQKSLQKYLRGNGDYRGDALVRAEAMTVQPPTASTPPPGRERLYQSVSQELKRIGMTNEGASRLLQTTIGKDSCKDCTNVELTKFLKELQAAPALTE